MKNKKKIYTKLKIDMKVNLKKKILKEYIQNKKNRALLALVNVTNEYRG